MEFKVICLQEPAFDKLIDTVIEYIKKNHSIQEPEWMTPDEAMKKLNVKKTKLQELRSEGKIEYSKDGTKNIMYKTASLNAWLEKNIKKTF